MLRSHGHSQRHSQKQSHKHRQAQAISHTQRLREAAAEEELKEVLEDDADSEPAADLPEEFRDSNDIQFDDESLEEIDYSWQNLVPSVRGFILPVLPRARWRVVIDHTASLTVQRLNGEADLSLRLKCKREILRTAAEFQRAFIETGDVEKLKVLKPEEVVSRITAPDSGADSMVVDVCKNQGYRVTSDIRGEHFYVPSGVLYSVSFLIQEDVCGVALSRVYHALAEITRGEQQGVQPLLEDRALADELVRRFPEGQFNAKKVARWREKDHEWSSMRLFFPNRDDRKKVYGKP